MRNRFDSNVIWVETGRILRSHIFHRDLQIRGPGSNDGPLTSMPRFLHNLEHCSGENAEILHIHFKQSKLIIKEFGVDLNSRVVVIVVVSSFTGQLGNWAADHANDIFKLDNIHALTAYFRVDYSNEDLEGKNLYVLIKLVRFDKSLHDYTHEFNKSYFY